MYNKNSWCKQTEMFKYLYENGCPQA